MCYTLYLSTSSSEDLTEYNSELIRFERLRTEGNECLRFLKNSEAWYVGSKSGCSCTFRHLPSPELGFGEPLDWYPEEEDELRATAELYGVIFQILSDGYHVDCLDIWEGGRGQHIGTMSVSLDAVNEKAFRLFENYHFIFEHGNAQGSR